MFALAYFVALNGLHFRKLKQRTPAEIVPDKPKHLFVSKGKKKPKANSEAIEAEAERKRAKTLEMR